MLPFPFSDLSSSKRRPALVVAPLPGDDVILCMITSRTVRNGNAIPLKRTDFASGGLPRSSCIRPDRLFTADSRTVTRSVGTLTADKLQQVVDAIVAFVNS